MISKKIPLIFVFTLIIILGNVFIQPSTSHANGNQTLGQLPIGSVVKDFNGHTEPWYVISHNHYGANHTLLLQKSIITNHVYDSQSTPWRDSQIRNYLRNTFYPTLSTNFQNSIKVVTTQSHGQLNSDDTVFLLSATELGNLSQYAIVDGPDGAEISGIAAFRHLESEYWTRTKHSAPNIVSAFFYHSDQRYVYTTGSHFSKGVRPAVNLNPDVPVFGPYGDDQYYTLFQGYKNDLSDLTINTGTLSPLFSSNQSNYSVTVPTEVNSIGLTPTAAYGNSTIKINGISVDSGKLRNVLLNYGVNVFRIEVTGEENVKKTYTITVTREKSSNANLKSLTISSGTITPAFTSELTNYEARLGNEVSTISVNASAQDSLASVKINGTNGTSKSIPLHTGENAINVEVTAQNGAKKIYHLKITREKSSNAFLSNLLKLRT